MCLLRKACILKDSDLADQTGQTGQTDLMDLMDMVVWTDLTVLMGC